MHGQLQRDIEAARERLEAGDVVGAARQVEAHQQALGDNEQLALLWSGLLGAVGKLSVLRRQVGRLSAHWPRNAGIILNCADAATRWADPWPPDAEPSGLPALAADIIARCMAGGVDPRVRGPLSLARARALARVGPAHDDEALELFEVGLGAAPEDVRSWVDLARFHQVRRRWAKGLGAAEHALSLAPDERPARWIAATCATALIEPRAADHWRILDHPADGTDGEGRPYMASLPAIEVVVTDRTPSPERIAAAGSDEAQAARPERAEALWIHPTSPVHGAVASPTVTDLPADHDDVVLWDPVPLGFREVDGVEIPRFAALAVVSRGRTCTWRFAADGTGARVEEAWPDGWIVYPFDDRVRGATGDGAAGKLVTPRGCARDVVSSALQRRGLRLASLTGKTIT